MNILNDDGFVITKHNDDLLADHAKFFIDRNGKGPFDFYGGHQYEECIETCQRNVGGLRELADGFNFIQKILPRLKEIHNDFSTFFSEDVAHYNGEFQGTKSECENLKIGFDSNVPRVVQMQKSLFSGLTDRFTEYWGNFLGYEGPLSLILDKRIDAYWEKDLILYTKIRDDMKMNTDPEILDCDYETYTNYLKKHYPEIWDNERYKIKSQSGKMIDGSASEKPIIEPVFDDVQESEIKISIEESHVREIVQDELMKLEQIASK